MATLQYLLDRRQHLIADSSFSSRLYSYRQLINPNVSLDNLIDTDALRDLQHAYLGGAVSLVLTNTFDANRFKLALLDMDAQTVGINERAAQLTRAATRGYERHVAVAGNIGPVGRSISHADAVNCYAEQAEALAGGGVDCFWLEAFTSREQAEAALIGCEIGAPHIPIIVTLSYVEGERLPLGIVPISATSELGKRPGVLAIGVDTGAGELDVLHSARQIGASCKQSALVVKVDLNAISAETNCHDISDKKSVDTYARIARAAINAGARIIAPGRDVTPRHLNAISAVIAHRRQHAADAQNKANISRKI